MAREYLCLIPARGGSKGIVGKNVQPCGGKPLVAWSVEQARATPAIGKVVVSTDDPEIEAVARRYGAETPFVRPVELAQDETPTEPVLLHALDYLAKAGYHPDAVILLQPTSPLRHADTLTRAIERFEQCQADSLVGVVESHSLYWKNGEAGPTALYDYRCRPRRQDLTADDLWYRETGSVYVTATERLIGDSNRLGGKIVLFPMREEEGYQIDSPADLVIMDALLRHYLVELCDHEFSQKALGV